MQLFGLHKKVYQVKNIDETDYSKEAYERLEKIKLFKKLRNEGCSRVTALEAIKTSQSTFYRWQNNYKRFGLRGLEDVSKCPTNIRKKDWKQHIIQQILTIRRQNPLYGKYKIAVLLKRDHRVDLSVSTVGRIISDLIRRDQIKPAVFYQGRKKVRSRVFNKHAKRLVRGMKATKPGELFQIDHMTVSIIAGYQVKHFQGICPVSKIMFADVYTDATSHTARNYLESLIKFLPFKVSSIQVDGGSEFEKEFELACAEMGIELYVLPPRSPEDNGCVERTNKSSKYEFYCFYDGDTKMFNVRKALNRYVHKYNNYRPHQALQYLTPQQYYTKISGA